jgi:hypothetical protein
MARRIHIYVSVAALALVSACGQPKAEETKGDSKLPPNSSIQATVPDKCQSITDPVERAKCVDQAKEAEKQKDKKK